MRIIESFATRLRMSHESHACSKQIMTCNFSGIDPSVVPGQFFACLGHVSNTQCQVDRGPHSHHVGARDYWVTCISLTSDTQPLCSSPNPQLSQLQTHWPYIWQRQLSPVILLPSPSRSLGADYSFI